MNGVAATVAFGRDCLVADSVERLHQDDVSSSRRSRMAVLGDVTYLVNSI